MDNHKVPYEFDNPVDRFLLCNIGEILGEKLHKYNFTPNMITTIGAIFRIISVYYLFRGHKVIFISTAILSYFFDCLDGFYARKYNMCTELGDMYDHISDTVYHFILMYYLFYRTNLPISPNYTKIKNAIIILFVLMLSHFGCQECHYNNIDCDHDCPSPTLGPFKKLCYNDNFIKFTRYFGSGTVLPLFYVLVYTFIR